MNRAKINRAIDQGLAYLVSAQQEKGGFLSFSSPNCFDFSQTTTYETTFTNTWILNCLLHLPSSTKRDQIIRKLANFLWQQMSPDWTWNYWVRSATEYEQLPYPDDLDDTFCTLAALHHYQPERFDGTAFGKISQVLIGTEQSPGGPYRTWLTNIEERIWRDIDLAVNSNIAYFLSLQSISLPALNELAEQSIASHTYHSPYYPDAYPLIYFLSRWYTGEQKDRLIKDTENLFKKARTSLRLALSATAHHRLTGSIRSSHTALGKILTNQQPDGSWPSEGFCLDPAIKGQRHYAGSPALTTAFCLEALALELSTTVLIDMSDEQRYHREVCELIDSFLEEQGQAISQQARPTVKRLLEPPFGHQITLAPYLTYKALGSPKTIKRPFLISLSAATACGWMAYSLIDDVVDASSNQNLLPLALILQREMMYRLNSTLSTTSRFPNLVRDTLDQMDKALQNEKSQFGLDSSNMDQPISQWQLPAPTPDTTLSDRSIGHALGPIAVLIKAGHPYDSTEARALTQFFRHYLAARQLSDDAHDWLEDLHQGQINSVSLPLLQQAQKLPIGSHLFNEIIPQLETLFWEQTIEQICDRITKQLDAAQVALEHCTSFVQPAVFHALISNERRTNDETLEQRFQARQFIATYSK